MNKNGKWLVALLVALVSFIFINVNNNVKASASYWHDGVPAFLTDDNYENEYGGEATFSNDSMSVNSSQNIIGGNDLSYHKASKHIYYIYAENDYDNDSDVNLLNYFKVKTSGDSIKVYEADNSFDDMSYWGTYTAE